MYPGPWWQALALAQAVSGGKVTEAEGTEMGLPKKYLSFAHLDLSEYMKFYYCITAFLIKQYTKCIYFT